MYDVCKYVCICVYVCMYVFMYIFTEVYIHGSFLGFASVSSVDTADLPDQNTGQGVWVELFDPEDREQLKYGDRVICLRHTGTVLS